MIFVFRTLPTFDAFLFAVCVDILELSHQGISCRERDRETFDAATCGAACVLVLDEAVPFTAGPCPAEAASLRVRMKPTSPRELPIVLTLPA